jgi:hypothetical protein
MLKDDVSVASLLGRFTAAQIATFIRMTSEEGCTHVAAILLQYQQEHFGQFAPLTEFTLRECEKKRLGRLKPRPYR